MVLRRNWLLAIILMVMVLSVPVNCVTMLEIDAERIRLKQRINGILDKISDEWEYLAWGADGHYVVTIAVKEHPDVELLIRNYRVSLPIIFERLEEKPQEYMKQPWFLIVCFIVFAETKSTEAIPHLIGYLSEHERKRRYSPKHPFLYAVDAIESITGVDIFCKRSDAFIKGWLGKVKKWYSKHKRQQD